MEPNLTHEGYGQPWAQHLPAMGKVLGFVPSATEEGQRKKQSKQALQLCSMVGPGLWCDSSSARWPTCQPGKVHTEASSFSSHS